MMASREAISGIGLLVNLLHNGNDTLAYPLDNGKGYGIAELRISGIEIKNRRSRADLERPSP